MLTEEKQSTMTRFYLLFLLVLIALPVNTHPVDVKSSIYSEEKQVFWDDQIQLFRMADFPVGVAVNTNKLFRDTRYRDLVIAEFNSITAENSMKPSMIHPSKEVYNFNETDLLIDFCKKHNKRLHGHTLVWYKDNPKWMEKFQGTKSEWELLLKNHIQTIITHCKSVVRSWDVVNEAFNDDGSLRQNIWLKHIGESYIEQSFRYAEEADPSAVLFYNDFDLESKPEKSEAVLKYLKKLRAKGVKIDGIGMQMHINVNAPYITDINLAAIKAESYGFLIHYSELDISTVKTGKFLTSRKHLMDLQGSRMKEIVRGYRNLKNTNRFGITVWGLSDEDSWLYHKNDHDKPLLFDNRYRVKPAYTGFLEGLKE
jgi:endo-1,4-beta-xylanase